ncbi:MAG: hypothetical protein PHC88_16725 [Terrimicrobiaceae bacterium]|nr:hypothetical protein [Terrimicrobiaceae bacterium]
MIDNGADIFQQALKLQMQNQLSFWDASVLSAALASGAAELWSEDFQHERNYGGIVAKNPFLSS